MIIALIKNHNLWIVISNVNIQLLIICYRHSLSSWKFQTIFFEQLLEKKTKFLFCLFSKAAKRSFIRTGRSVTMPDRRPGSEIGRYKKSEIFDVH